MSKIEDFYRCLSNYEKTVFDLEVTEIHIHFPNVSIEQIVEDKKQMEMEKLNIRNKMITEAKNKATK